MSVRKLLLPKIKKIISKHIKKHFPDAGIKRFCVIETHDHYGDDCLKLLLIFDNSREVNYFSIKIGQSIHERLYEKGDERYVFASERTEETYAEYCKMCEKANRQYTNNWSVEEKGWKTMKYASSKDLTDNELAEALNNAKPTEEEIENDRWNDGREIIS